jgi:hypothetical protein
MRHFLILLFLRVAVDNKPCKRSLYARPTKKNPGPKAGPGKKGRVEAENEAG